MTLVAGLPELWEIPAGDSQLANGRVYHCWLKVEDTSANTAPLPLVCCTSPMAFTVDWRVFPPGASDNRQPPPVPLKCYFQTANESCKVTFWTECTPELCNTSAGDSAGRFQATWRDVDLFSFENRLLVRE